MNVLFSKWQQHLETGIKYLSDGNYVGAEEQLKISLEEAETLQVPVIIAFSQRLLATAQVRNNKLEEAESGFYRAFNYCRQLNNEKGMAEAKAGLASICFVQGNYRQAIDWYQQAINIYPQNSSSLRLAVLYTDLGQVYSRLREWKKAIDAFLQAGALCKAYGYVRGEADIYLYLGEVQYSQGKNQAAKGSFMQAAKIYALLADEISLANSHQYLAFILLETNRIYEALEYQYRVIVLHFKKRQYSEVSEAYYLLSYILQYAKLLDEAEESLKLSLKYYKGHEFGFAVRYHGLAVIAIMKKEYEDAKKYYYEALKFFQFHGDGSKVGEISEELTYLLKYKDACIKQNLYKWLQGRYVNVDMPKYEVMLQLANRLKNKGNNLAALRYGWRALELAKVMKGETQEIEGLIQNLSECIRRKK